MTTIKNLLRKTFLATAVRKARDAREFLSDYAFYSKFNTFGGAHFTDIVNWLSKFKKSPWQSSHTVQTGAHRTARPSSAYRYRLGR